MSTSRRAPCVTFPQSQGWSGARLALHHSRSYYLHFCSSVLPRGKPWRDILKYEDVDVYEH